MHQELETRSTRKLVEKRGDIRQNDPGPDRYMASVLIHIYRIPSFRPRHTVHLFYITRIIFQKSITPSASCKSSHTVIPHHETFPRTLRVQSSKSQLQGRAPAGDFRNAVCGTLKLQPLSGPTLRPCFVPSACRSVTGQQARTVLPSLQLNGGWDRQMGLYQIRVCHAGEVGVGAGGDGSTIALGTRSKHVHQEKWTTEHGCG